MAPRLTNRGMKVELEECEGVSSFWVSIGTKVVEVTVVRTSVVVGLPFMVVSTGVRVVMTVTEGFKRIADLRTTAAELAK